MRPLQKVFEYRLNTYQQNKDLKLIMQIKGTLKIGLTALTVLVCAGVAQGKTPMPMNELVPRAMHGWTMHGTDETYDRKTIFDYMDGAGEIYLAYGFTQLLVRNFANLEKPDEPQILVELFDMGSSQDAFGIFSHCRESEEGDIGQGSQYQGGLLYFWKGRFFVCVSAKQETPAAKQAVMALGKVIANTIPEIGEKPALLDYLPEDGLIPHSVRYFHTHPMLNYHYFVATENILKLDASTSAVLAQYQHPEGKSYLLIVEYPTPTQARAAYDSFRTAYFPEPYLTKNDLAELEKGKWTSVHVHIGRAEHVAIVFDAPTADRAKALLRAVQFRKKPEVRNQ
jgi:hypothetical protein